MVHLSYLQTRHDIWYDFKWTCLIFLRALPAARLTFTADLKLLYFGDFNYSTPFDGFYWGVRIGFDISGVNKVKPAVFSRFVGYMQAYLQDVFLKILVFEPKNRNMYH